MAVAIEEAAEAYREAMRAAIKKFSLWYLVEGVLLVAAGVLAIIYPIVSSVAALWIGRLLRLTDAPIASLVRFEPRAFVEFAKVYDPIS